MRVPVSTRARMSGLEIVVGGMITYELVGRTLQAIMMSFKAVSEAARAARKNQAKLKDLSDQVLQLCTPTILGLQDYIEKLKQRGVDQSALHGVNCVLNQLLEATRHVEGIIKDRGGTCGGLRNPRK